MSREYKSIEDFPDILTAKHVAQMLHMSLDYVRKLARENKIPSHKLPGGSHFRFFKSEIIEWLRSQGHGGYLETPVMSEAEVTKQKEAQTSVPNNQ